MEDYLLILIATFTKTQWSKKDDEDGIRCCLDYSLMSVTHKLPRISCHCVGPRPFPKL